MSTITPESYLEASRALNARKNLRTPRGNAPRTKKRHRKASKFHRRLEISLWLSVVEARRKMASTSLTRTHKSAQSEEGTQLQTPVKKLRGTHKNSPRIDEASVVLPEEATPEPAKRKPRAKKKASE